MALSVAFAAIVKTADSTGAGPIIMAAGVLTGAPRKLVGRVVERVLRGTKCPVLVVTPAGGVVDTSFGDVAPLPAPAATLRVRSSSATPRVPGGRRPPPSDSRIS
jgi:Universal stress protein family